VIIYIVLYLHNMVLSLDNKRICDFYKLNPTINFESVNLIFIELFEKLLNGATDGIMNPSIQTQVLSAISDGANNMIELKQSISSLKETVSTDIISKFAELKREYIEGIKDVVQTNTYENINPVLDKHHTALINKTTLILNDMIPKNHTQLYSQISEHLTTFKQSLVEDTRNPSSSSLKELIQNFEIKSSLMLQNIQQPIYSYISSSEDRIASAIKANNHTIVSELSEVLTEFRNKPATTQHLSGILTKLYNSAEITTQNSLGNPGTVLMKRIRKTNILVQTKDADENIGTDAIQSFMTIIEEQNCNGIFISQKSGIATKKNFQIELHNNNVIVFIHNGEYSTSKIELAISIIDNLAEKLRQFRGKADDDCAIPKEVLDTINNEYQLFISQKNAVIDVFKESQRKVLAQIDELRFPSLDKFLSTKYSAPIQKPGLKCDLCKSFSANNLKALAAHKRGCIRKNAVSPITVPIANQLTVMA